MCDTAHDFYPDDQRRLIAKQLPDGRWQCTPPYVDPHTFEEREVVTATWAALLDAGYETEDD